VSEIGIVVSCGDSGGKGWRTELDLDSGKSLDDRKRQSSKHKLDERGILLTTDAERPRQLG